MGSQYYASLVQRIELESSKLRMVVRFHHGAPKLMESNAAGMVLRPALKTGFSEMGWGSTPPLSAKQWNGPIMVLEQIANLSLGVIRVLSSSLSRSAIFLKERKMKTKDVLDRAYGSMANEPTPYLNLELLTFRGVKYYWLIFIRRFIR